MHDLAGRLAGALVHLHALPPGEGTQRALGELGAEGQHHARGPQAVAAEQGEVPGHAGPDEGVPGRRARLGEPQRAQVVQRPGEQPAEAVVGCRDLQVGPFGGAGGGGHHRGRVGDAGAPAQRDALPRAEGDRPGEGGGRAGLGVRVRTVHLDGDAVGPPGQPPVAGGLGGQGGAVLPGLDPLDGGEVAAELHAHLGGHRPSRGRGDLDGLAHAAGGDGTGAVDADGGVDGVAVEPARQGDEPGAGRAVDGGAHRFGFLAVHQQPHQRQGTPVGVEEALGPGVPDLAVGAAERGRGRGDRAHQVVQQGLPGGWVGLAGHGNADLLMVSGVLWKQGLDRTRSKVHSPDIPP